jgi:hypothetical protein
MANLLLVETEGKKTSEFQSENFRVCSLLIKEEIVIFGNEKGLAFLNSCLNYWVAQNDMES